jgi:hypothetical protein
MKITSFDLRTKPKEEIYRKRTISKLRKQLYAFANKFNIV